MKKLLIVITLLLPILATAQTKPVYHYDSLGNVYYYDPTVVTLKENTITKPHPAKTKTIIRRTASGRKLKYTITY